MRNTLENFLKHFKEGYRVHSTAHNIIRRYEEPCEESNKKLEEAGITRENWRRLMLGYDLSLEGVAYSLGGTISWIRSGMPD